MVAVRRVKCACQLHQKPPTHCTTLAGTHAPGKQCISPLACGSKASSSAAVMSLMAGSLLAAMITTVPRRSSSRASGSMPAGDGARWGQQALLRYSQFIQLPGTATPLAASPCSLSAWKQEARPSSLTEDDVRPAVVNKQHRPLVGVAAQHSREACGCGHIGVCWPTLSWLGHGKPAEYSAENDCTNGVAKQMLAACYIC